jgi:hypothetical protein
VHLAAAHFSVGPRAHKQKKKGQNMSLLSIIVTLIVAGVLLWLVNTYIPMDGKIKKILNIVVVVVVVLWLFNVFGLWGQLRNVHV